MSAQAIRPEGAFGPLEVYCGRGFSTVIALASFLVLIAGIIALMKSGSAIPVPAKLLIGVVTLGMLWGSVVGVRRLLTPPLMFRADRRGITIHYDARSNSYRAPGVFLPWDLVSSLELKEVVVWGATNRGKTWVIACLLSGEPPFAAKEHSVISDQPWSDRAVALDALTGTVAREELLTRLKQLHRSGQAGMTQKTKELI